MVSDGANLTWEDQAGGLGIVETPSGLVDGINDVYSLAFNPTTITGVLVFIDGVALKADEYVYATQSITINSIPQLGQSVHVFYMTDQGSINISPTLGSHQVIYRTITVWEEISEVITLASAPTTPSRAKLDVIGGSAQAYGTDFEVSGSTLSWVGKRLDLVENDEIRIEYFS